MRMMMKVVIPVEAGNKGIAQGTLANVVDRFIEQHDPEASYFVSEHGRRTAFFFFDLRNARDIPMVAESFFMELNASVEITPAMNAADMKAGVEEAMRRR